MAIKETTKKIHFIPYTAQKGKDADVSDAPTVTILSCHSSGVRYEG